MRLCVPFLCANRFPHTLEYVTSEPWFKRLRKIRVPIETLRSPSTSCTQENILPSLYIIASLLPSLGRFIVLQNATLEAKKHVKGEIFRVFSGTSKTLNKKKSNIQRCFCVSLLSPTKSQCEIIRKTDCSESDCIQNKTAELCAIPIFCTSCPDKGASGWSSITGCFVKRARKGTPVRCL